MNTITKIIQFLQRLFIKPTARPTNGETKINWIYYYRPPLY